MALISMCTTLIQSSFPGMGRKDSNYKGKEAVNYPFGTSTCVF